MRRHLGFSVDEAEGLPWWQYRLYMEGLTEELTGEAAPEYEYVGGERQASLEELAALGFGVG